ncbi:MAG: SDR family NAD(P)-dependent oxidoreductase, partial [bacterium]|nr:SDR family NAD(P)-dependent oxidoreductase [bacterium]
MNVAWMFIAGDASHRLFRPTHPKKLGFFLLTDTAIICGTLVAAFLIRFDFAWNVSYYALIPRAIPLFLGVKLASFWFFQLYSLSWRFVSLRDLANIAKAVAFSSLAIAAIIYPFHVTAFTGFPRGVLLIDGMLTLVLIATLRIAKRVALEVVRSSRSTESGKRTIIVGAGNTGEMVLRDIQRTQYAAYAPVAFLDDDPSLIGSHLHGVRVRGGLDDLATFIQTLHAEAVIVAIQSIGHQRLRVLYRAARDAGAHVKIVPRLYDIHAPQVRLQAIEDISIEDLIRREPIRVDEVAIRRAIAGKAVLVTGAAGSIGSEIVRQVCRYGPRTLTCFEVDETELHRMQLTLEREFRGLAERVAYVVGDIRDADRVDEVFTRYRPDVVYHAAAYKHVPMMESNVAEAVKANIVGTWNVAEAARRVGTERFVLISTDKAVRPTSVMG